MLHLLDEKPRIRFVVSLVDVTSWRFVLCAKAMAWVYQAIVCGRCELSSQVHVIAVVLTLLL